MNLFAVGGQEWPAESSSWDGLGFIAGLDWPTILVSLSVGLGGAWIAAKGQRWSILKTIEHERSKQRLGLLEQKLSALRAYEGALQDAAINLESIETHLPTGIHFPKNLDELRVAARPHYAYLETSDRKKYWLVNDPGAVDGQPMEASDSFQAAREALLTEIEEIEKEYQEAGGA